MTTIPLLTSIPPKLKRLDVGKHEVGAAYQELCIDSWISSGFKPFSLNSPQEQLPRALSDKIDVIPVSQDAREETGRPLVYLSDFIKGGQLVGNPVVAVTNADIFLDFDPKLLECLKALEQGQFVLGHRTDVDDAQQMVNPGIYDKGFDFFAFHTADLDRMYRRGIPRFVFGMPWWDYYLPLAALICGMEGKTLSDSKILHLRHDNRWNGVAGDHFGRLFLQEMRSARKKISPGAIHSRDFEDFFAKLENPPPLTSTERAKVMVKRAIFGKRYSSADHLVARASSTTQRFLIQWTSASKATGGAR